jgi:hypothetical protein
MAPATAVDPITLTSRSAAVRSVLLPLIADARSAGPPPELGTPEWLAAEPLIRFAAVFAELLRHLDAATLRELAAARDRRDAPLRAQRQASHAISAAEDWTAASRRPSHAELVRRRAEVVRPC